MSVCLPACHIFHHVATVILDLIIAKVASYIVAFDNIVEFHIPCHTADVIAGDGIKNTFGIPKCTFHDLVIIYNPHPHPQYVHIFIP